MIKLFLFVLVNILHGIMLLVRYYNNIPQDLKDSFKKYSDTTMKEIDKQLEKFR